jgi:hypothetical protein
LHHNTTPAYTSFFTSIFLTKNNMTVGPQGRYFDTTKVIDAESLEVLNTLMEHDFQDAFKKRAEALGTVHTCRRELLGR